MHGPFDVDHTEFTVIQPATNHDDPNATGYAILRDGTKVVFEDNFHDVWGAVCHHTQVAEGHPKPVPLPERFAKPHP